MNNIEKYPFVKIRNLLESLARVTTTATPQHPLKNPVNDILLTLADEARGILEEMEAAKK